MAKKMRLPIGVFLFRDPSGQWEQVNDGDLIDWKIGEKAKHRGSSGKVRDVTIDSRRGVHEAVPGEAVYEVIFDDDPGKRYSVSARRLRHPNWNPQ